MCEIHHLAVILHVTTFFLSRGCFGMSELCIDFDFINSSSPCLTSVTTLKQLTALPLLLLLSVVVPVAFPLFLEWSPPCPYFPYSFEIVMAQWWSYLPFRISGQSDSS